MITIKVYDGPAKTNQVFIDLYEESAIKLNFSIEDITNTEAKSVYSRTFRVPGTANNNKFFKWAFMVDDADFDVTVKLPAEIYVDGNLFRQGQVRLQKMYNNQKLNRYDYELIFLGETRDFASTLSDMSLCELDLSHLVHVLNYGNVSKSWEAYPSTKTATGTTITPSFTNGLKNGDVVYPLVDFGFVPPASGDNPRIAVVGDHLFTNNDLPLDRLKPVVRAKAIVDAIFADTEYSYEPGGFFDSDEFKQMYVSAWGNTSSVELDTSASNNICEAVGNLTYNQGYDEVLWTPQENFDPGNNFTTIPHMYYTAQVTGNYNFLASCYFSAREETVGQPGARINFEKQLAGTTTWVLFDSGFTGWNTTLTNSTLAVLNAGDRIRAWVENVGVDDGYDISDQFFACTAAPGEVNIAAQFDCDYKQIDFIKDLLTTFRLVMSPRRDNPKEFIIEPWVDYVASGDMFDWSSKVDRSQDLVIEPLFDTQTDIIYFDHAEDKDHVNQYHIDAYKYVYGHLEFDSGNDLLVGSRKIETKWASTPIIHIEGAASNSTFVIPVVHQHGDGDTHSPIKPKSRLLYYNGLQPAANNWRLEGAPAVLTLYPLVSNSNSWPMSAGGKVLNWYNDIGYWGSGVSSLPTQLGQSLYNAYWNGYIQSLYNKAARRVTGTFILNSTDLQEFSFDDIIFLDGQYYRVEKIIDAPIGTTDRVKVQLIKLLNFKP